MTLDTASAFPVVVAHVRENACDIHLFALHAADGGDLPAFTAGAHVVLQVPCGLWRKYSLCNDPRTRDCYEIAVKREREGHGGSASLIDYAGKGSKLLCTPPQNDFELSEHGNRFIFIAGGIGITPLMAMMRHLKSSGRGSFKLYYATRSAADTAFREELTGPDYRGQVVIHHDDGDPARAFDLWPVLERPTGAHLYCCGPRPLMEAVRDMTGHWSPSTVHFESFVEATATHKPEDRAFKVRLVNSGKSVDVPADQSILEALRAAGATVPSSCESGTCGTCRTRLLGGAADHRDLVLTDAERDDYIMVCISRAKSDELVLDL